MEITEWEPPRLMGVRHTGLVTGSGRFRLEALGGGRTGFTWDEDLRFPWFLGAGPGAAAARPILRRVWRRNLARLRQVVEADPA